MSFTKALCLTAIKNQAAHSKPGLNAVQAVCVCVCVCVLALLDSEWGLRLREVVGDEVGAFEEQKYITEAVTLQGAVQGDPIRILGGRHTKTCLLV